jgi:hypothetical protein
VTELHGYIHKTNAFEIKNVFFVHLFRVYFSQGDQIWRVFAYRTIVVSGQIMCLKMIIQEQLFVNFDKKWDRTKFWAIFSQTHPVTLISARFRIFLSRINRTTFQQFAFPATTETAAVK